MKPRKSKVGSSSDELLTKAVIKHLENILWDDKISRISQILLSQDMLDYYQ